MIRYMLAVVLGASVLALAIGPVAAAQPQSVTICIAPDLSASLRGGPAVSDPLDRGSSVETNVIDSLITRLGPSSTKIVAFGTSAKQLDGWNADEVASYGAEVGQETNIVAAWQACLETGASRVIIISDFAPDARAMSRDAQLAWFIDHPSAVQLDGIAFDGQIPEPLRSSRTSPSGAAGHSPPCAQSLMLNQP